MVELEILKKIPAFASFDSEILTLIQKSGKLITVNSGDKLLGSSEENKSSLLLVLKGKLRLALIGHDFTMVPLTFLNKEDYWGEFGLLDGNNITVEITADETTDVVVYSRDIFLNKLNENRDLFRLFVNGLAARLRNSHFIVDSLLVKDSDAKVARTILKLGLEQGSVKASMLEINKLPAQQELAKIAGTSRETLSRTLQSFAKKSLIELDGSKLRIKDFMKLREIVI